MSAITIPVYCGLTGCWQIARLDGRDVKNHPCHACSIDHLAELRVQRERIYTEVARIQAEYRANWRNYVYKMA
jgi:hypothetical protein